MFQGALYQSPHIDENDVQTISHRCEVISYFEYKARKLSPAEADNNDLYYLAGYYEPTVGMIKWESDVKLLPAAPAKATTDRRHTLA